MEQDVYGWVASDFLLEETAIKHRAASQKVVPQPITFHTAAVAIMARHGIEADDILYIDPNARPGMGRVLDVPTLPSGRLPGRSLAEYRVIFLGAMADSEEREEAMAALSSASFPGLVLVGWSEAMPATFRFAVEAEPEMFTVPAFH